MKSFYNRITSRASKLVLHYHLWLAGGLLVLMAALAGGSMIGNSAIIDEIAHIPAGYAYLHFSDYRLNPEHPPLMKDLAAIPLQFMHLMFPDAIPAWTTEVNGQWDTGWNFIYHIGNNADAILLWARLPILLLALTFGAALYLIVWRRWGVSVALLTLGLYALSPNILAHSALVTTDLGASVMMFLAMAAFARYVDRPGRGTLGWLALALTAAQLTKFSSLLLYPFLGIISIALVWLMRSPNTMAGRLRTYVGGFAGASILSLLGVWLYYFTQVAHMPADVQDRLIRGSFTFDRIRFMGEALVSLNQLPLMHPLVQYLAGVGMVFGRVTGGNVTYFNGHVQSGSFQGYFPELFLVKTQVALLVLAATAFVYVIWRARNTPAPKWLGVLAANIRTHILEWTLGAFVLFYFAAAIAGNLNLGIRHILPIFAPIFALVAVATVHILRHLRRTSWRKPATAIVGLLLAWYAGSTIAAYPNYLSYFNEIIGGPANSAKYFSDSSVDWGQDLKRFKVYVTAHPEIHHIALDYFGGGSPAYYFCARRYNAAGALVATADGYDCSRSVYQEWHAQYGTYSGQYIAVSETFLENDPFYAKLYSQAGYGYLRARQPIAKIGNSIFIYKLY